MQTFDFTALLIVASGYLLGSILPAELIVRHKTGRSMHELDDNPGGAGTYRKAGLAAAAFVSVFDIAKGIVPVALADALGFKGWWLAAAASAPVVGHNWPVLLRFRGGKGLAAAIGAIGWLGWPYILPAYLLGGLAVLWRRWAPMMGLVAIPLSLLLMGWAGLPGERLLAVLMIVVVLVIREIPWLWAQYQERARAGKVT
jgi:glycerol-3-phosphate acyltransferase PlsY